MGVVNKIDGGMLQISSKDTRLQQSEMPVYADRLLSPTPAIAGTYDSLTERFFPILLFRLSL
jgi:hypothetical protein